MAGTHVQAARLKVSARAPQARYLTPGILRANVVQFSDLHCFARAVDLPGTVNVGADAWKPHLRKIRSEPRRVRTAVADVQAGKSAKGDGARSEPASSIRPCRNALGFGDQPMERGYRFALAVRDLGSGSAIAARMVLA